MHSKPIAFAVSVLAFAAFAAPASAARQVAYSNSVKTVGNNVTIKSSGGVTVVESSNSCSPGISGYLYQSIIVFFGGSVITTTQSTYCP